MGLNSEEQGTTTITTPTLTDAPISLTPEPQNGAFQHLNTIYDKYLESTNITSRYDLVTITYENRDGRSIQKLIDPFIAYPHISTDEEKKSVQEFLKVKPLEYYIFNWVRNNSETKLDLLKYLRENPDKAAEQQRYTTWALSKISGGSDYKLDVFNGKVTMYRTVGGDEPILPWDSVTDNEQFATAWQKKHQRGPVFEFELPIENVFAGYLTTNAFYIANEREFILNDRGLEGAKLLKVNGKEPTPEDTTLFELSRNHKGDESGVVTSKYIYPPE